MLQRIGKVWAQVVAFENLLQAYKKARRGKSRSKEVACFDLDFENQLFRLQAELKTATYCPGSYRQFTLYERKPRMIAAAPFRDRVVHHALLNIIEPILDRRFIDDSYACRKGKGVHSAVDRYQAWARRYTYVLKMDVRYYFYSIDRFLLKQKLRNYIKDRPVLALFDLIIDQAPTSVEFASHRRQMGLAGPEGPKGIPIGNLTSQFLANLYLDDLDHAVKERWGVRAYLRYVDDLVVLADNKKRLHEIREKIGEYLAWEQLLLHPKKAHISQTSKGLDILGYFVFPRRRYLRNDNGHRFARRLRGFAAQYYTGAMAWEDFNPSVQSWLGHAKHADTKGLRRTLFGATVFTRGAGL